ncbi:MAG: 50S ribosomal protein L18 [Clostridiaceae bacterium]|jgi:large subunit ribosomal protein L18|nr:50S ribosomal protein L18 [Clostridiaceae bacterium]
MSQNISRNDIRKRKHARVRAKISGTGERPRLCVFRSLTNIYAQVIDDMTGQTLASASTLDQEIKAQGLASGNKQGAAAVGKLVAARALDKGVTNVVFDRGGYIYHGRVAALAEAAREAGLKF